MKIKRMATIKAFKDLNIGDVFRYGGDEDEEIFIKIECDKSMFSSPDNAFNAVSLRNGRIADFVYPSVEVEALENATLVY